MKRNPLIYALFVLSIIAQVSCAPDDLSPPGDDSYGYYFEGPIVIWNLSLFDQLEIYAHPYLDDYQSHPETPENLLTDGPLADQEIAVIQFRQNYHITAIREQVAGGPKMLLTTAIGLPIYDPYHVLMVFRDGFRLLKQHEAEQISSFPGWPEEITNWPPENTNED